MFERFSERGKHVIVASRRIASQTRNCDIAPEHILFGLLATDKNLALRFLGSAWATEDIWREFAQGRALEVGIPEASDLPLSSASKRVIAFAEEEADMMHGRRVCTEHLLLALLRDGKSLTCELLNRRSVEYAAVRVQLLREPHQDAKIQEFVKSDPQDGEVAQLKSRIESIRVEIKGSISHRDFARAMALSTEEKHVRHKLIQLFIENGSLDWLYD